MSCGVDTRMKDLLGIPWQLGARFGSGSIDCYGVAIEIARRRGQALCDAWPVLLEAWRGGAPVLQLIERSWLDPWQRVEAGAARARPQDLDIWLTNDRRPGVGIIVDGRLWTATPEAGVVSLAPAAAGTPVEVWRRWRAGRLA